LAHRGKLGLLDAWIRLAAVVALAGGAFAFAASSASAADFTNSATIAIADTPNRAPDNGTPYPSNIAVFGLGTITDVNVTISGFSHTQPDDVGLVLVGPGGQALELMNAAGGETDANNLTFKFDDSAGAQLPGNGTLTTGTYKPTAYDHLLYPAPGPGLTFGNPGPDAGGTATLASTFNGTAANGAWKLFVRDFYDLDSGMIAGGWSLNLSSLPLPPGPNAKRKCKKTKKHAATAKKKKCKRKHGRK
jgi:hypothetical protein